MILGVSWGIDGNSLPSRIWQKPARKSCQCKNSCDLYNRVPVVFRDIPPNVCDTQTTVTSVTHKTIYWFLLLQLPGLKGILFTLLNHNRQQNHILHSFSNLDTEISKSFMHVARSYQKSTSLPQKCKTSAWPNTIISSQNIPAHIKTQQTLQMNAYLSMHHFVVLFQRFNLILKAGVLHGLLSICHTN